MWEHEGNTAYNIYNIDSKKSLDTVKQMQSSANELCLPTTALWSVPEHM